MPPKKIGRPPSDNPKNITLRIRVDADTLKDLDDCVQKLESNRSEVIRQGIDMVKDSLKE